MKEFMVAMGVVGIKMDNEVIINIYKKADRWRFDAICGKYRLGGFGESIEDAEDKALFAIKGIPNQGVVHVFHEK